MSRANLAPVTAITVIQSCAPRATQNAAGLIVSSSCIQEATTARQDTWPFHSRKPLFPSEQCFIVKEGSSGRQHLGQRWCPDLG